MSNGIMFQGFEWYVSAEGNFYKWMTSEIEKYKEIGFTSIWLPPMSKATSEFDVGYGIYDLFDLGEFDQKGQVRTKYGTKEELLTLIETAHEHGISVYADIVLNHKAGADYSEVFKVVKVNPDNRLEEISEPYDIEGFTGFDFPGRKGKYSEFKWNFNHFTGVDYDHLSGENGVYKILGENKDWSLGVSGEKGNYDYLMFADINHSHPEVREELFHYSDWLVETTGVDGFRLDAMRHINDYFIRDFVKHTLEKQKEGFYIFGEYWTADLDKSRNFTYQTDFEIDLFDVGLHFNFHQASLANELYDLRKIFDNTLVQSNPTMAVTFVDNHDSQPDQSLSSWVGAWFKPLAYGIILLRQEGYPCVFFGDYYGVGGEYPEEGKAEVLEKLMLCRKSFAYGQQDDYFNDPNVVGWVRHGDEEHPFASATILSNKDDSLISMYVGEHYAGQEFADYLGNHPDKVMINEDGYGNFKVYKRSISCWVKDDTVI